ncbi:MAG TPA: GNAT family N-acetyltransferase [Casimicrobiaceae bacterium]|nr:GNAT family N-acetyltransferase [Casimicrobiaceae bacterium]
MAWASSASVSTGTTARWRVYSPGEFPRFVSAWNALNDSQGGVCVLDAMFVASALDAFGDGRERLGVRSRGDDVDAIGLFVPERLAAWRTFQPSQMPLGAFVARPGVDIDEALGSLLGALPGFALAVSLTQQDPALTPLPPTSGTLASMPYIETAWVAVDSSFDDYWAKRGKNLRTNVRRQLARLDAEKTVHRLDVVRRADEVASAIADYGTLESAGWKAQGGTAVHGENAQGRFYRELFEDFCREGSGRIYRYCIGERIAAMDLCVEANGTLVILKTAYDEFFKAVSPASLMRFEYFRPLFDRREVRRIEFYGRLMEWHTRWTDEKRTLYHVNRYRGRYIRHAHRVANALSNRIR